MHASRRLGMAARRVSPGETPDVEADDTKAAPLLDFEAVERRFRRLETTPNQTTIDATLSAIATREPTSFHQATIYYGLERQDTPPRRKYGLLATSIGIVFLQCFVATGLGQGVTLSTCSEHSDCSRGTFCDEGICDWCYLEYKPCCRTNSTRTCVIAEKEREGMCTTCTTSKGWETFQDVVKDRMDSMLVQDWITLLLASIVVAFAVFAEIRDCMLCEITLREISKRREVPRGWRYAIRGLNYVRYILLLPNIIVSVMSLVHEDGGRVKYVCLNTVAVLFILEVDNLAFLHGLGERTRMEAEQHAHAGARVTEDDLRMMGVVKLICVVTIPSAIFGGVCGHSVLRDNADVFILMLAPLPSLVVVFVQRVMASRRKLKKGCGEFGWAILNYIMFMSWFLIFYFLMFVQVHGRRSYDGWWGFIVGSLAMFAFTLVLSICTDNPPKPSAESSSVP